MLFVKKFKFYIPIATGTTCFGLSLLFWKSDNDKHNDEKEKHQKRPILLWGDNHFGLVNPLKSDSNSMANPQLFPLLHNVKQISAGTEHAAAIDEQGNLYQWGNAIEPKGGIVHTLSNVKSISCNDRWVFALTTNDNLHILPAKEKIIPKIQMPKERIVNFQVGNDHLVALSCCGKVLTAPLSIRGNWLGQLGRESQELTVKSYHSLKEQQNDSFSHLTDLEKSIKILNQEIEAPNRKVEQDHLNIPLEQFTLVKLDEKDIPWKGKKIIELAVGDDHTILRDEDGMIYGFGSNEQLQLGLGPFDQGKRIIKRPVPIETITVPVDQIACGGNSSYFLINNRSLALSCGHGQFGQLGNGRFTHVNGEPTPIKTISNKSFFDESSKTLKNIPIHSISAGKTHAGVIFDTSNTLSNDQIGYDIYLWGLNVNHQLGNGMRSNSPIPIPIKATSQSLIGIDDGNDSGNNNDQDYIRLIGDELQIKSKQIDGSPSLNLYCGPQITALY